MKWNKVVKNTKKTDPRHFLCETSVKVGDKVTSLSQDWDGEAEVTDIDQNTLPAILTVSLDGDTFETTLDDAEVVSGN